MNMIDVSNRDTTCVIRFERPPANAFNLAFVEEFAGILDSVAARPPTGGVVLTGSGALFSGGVDFKEAPGYDAHQRMRMIDAINRAITTLYGMPAPTVAVLNGHAMGGAFVLALACDVRIARTGPIRMALSEITAGIPYPACPMEVLKSEMDASRRRWLALGGEDVDGEAALAAGILDKQVAPECLLDCGVTIVQQRSRLPAYARIKQQLRADTLTRMRSIISDGSDPMRLNWIG